MKIDKQILKDWGACSDGRKWFDAKFPQGADYPEVSNALRDEKRYSDSNWLTTNVFNSLFQEPAQISDFVKSDVSRAIEDAMKLVAASGDDSKLAASGVGSKLAASGDDSKLAASGVGSNLAASGDDSKLAASGDDSNLEANGIRSVAMVAGSNGRASAGEQGAFALAWRDGDQMRIAVGIVGENGIKAGVVYRVGNTGELEEVEA